MSQERSSTLPAFASLSPGRSRERRQSYTRELPVRPLTKGSVASLSIERTVVGPGVVLTRVAVPVVVGTRRAEDPVETRPPIAGGLHVGHAERAPRVLEGTGDGVEREARTRLASRPEGRLARAVELHVRLRDRELDAGRNDLRQRERTGEGRTRDLDRVCVPVHLGGVLAIERLDVELDVGDVCRDGRDRGRVRHREGLGRADGRLDRRVNTASRDRVAGIHVRRIAVVAVLRDGLTRRTRPGIPRARVRVVAARHAADVPLVGAAIAVIVDGVAALGRARVDLRVERGAVPVVVSAVVVVVRVAGVTEAVAVGVDLVRVRDRRAVVDVVDDPVAILVGGGGLDGAVEAGDRQNRNGPAAVKARDAGGEVQLLHRATRAVLAVRARAELPGADDLTTLDHETTIRAAFRHAILAVLAVFPVLAVVHDGLRAVRALHLDTALRVDDGARRAVEAVRAVLPVGQVDLRAVRALDDRAALRVDDGAGLAVRPVLPAAVGGRRRARLVEVLLGVENPIPVEVPTEDHARDRLAPVGAVRRVRAVRAVGRVGAGLGVSVTQLTAVEVEEKGDGREGRDERTERVHAVILQGSTCNVTGVAKHRTGPNHQVRWKTKFLVWIRNTVTMPHSKQCCFLLGPSYGLRQRPFIRSLFHYMRQKLVSSK